jgi:hypothetical protein
MAFITRCRLRLPEESVVRGRGGERLNSSQSKKGCQRGRKAWEKMRRSGYLWDR